jgi:hypothetical protein
MGFERTHVTSGSACRGEKGSGGGRVVADECSSCSHASAGRSRDGGGQTKSTMMLMLM